MVDECHLLWGDNQGYVWGNISERISIPIINEKESQTSPGWIKFLDFL